MNRKEELELLLVKQNKNLKIINKELSNERKLIRGYQQNVTFNFDTNDRTIDEEKTYDEFSKTEEKKQKYSILQKQLKYNIKEWKKELALIIENEEFQGLK